MAQPTNPLLIALREAFPKAQCIRAYTTTYKAGGFRVKLYGAREATRRMHFRAKLSNMGFSNVKVEQISPNHSPAWSVIITAQDKFPPPPAKRKQPQ